MRKMNWKLGLVALGILLLFAGYMIFNGKETDEATAVIQDLAAGSSTAETITLNWTAPAGSGNNGRVVGYDIRYSTEGPIDTETKWEGATLVNKEPSPGAPGTAQSMVIEGLAAMKTYYFAIKSLDEAKIVSALSNTDASAATLEFDVDTEAPGQITDLAVKAESVNQVGLVLQWTTPSDDNGQKELTYDLRYSKVGEITEANWDDANHTVKREFTPVVVYNASGNAITTFDINTKIDGVTLGIDEAGTAQEWLVNPLFPKGNYWFAIKTVDKAGNVSLLSNTNVTAATPDINPDNVRVTNMFELRDAVESAPPTGRVITLAPGIYQQGYEWIDQTAGGVFVKGKNHITFQGETGNPDDVVIKGTGMFREIDLDFVNDPELGEATTEINVRIIGSDFITFKDLSVKDSTYHHFQLVNNPDYHLNGSDYFKLSNVKMVDAGEGPIKGTTPFTPNGPYQDFGVVENSYMGFSSTEVALDAKGVKISTGFSFGMEPVACLGWTVRNNTFENFRNPNELVAGTYGVYTKGTCIDMVVEGNTFINNFSAISYGDGGTVDPYKRGWSTLKYKANFETIGGIIRNNVIKGSVDVPIYLNDAKDIKIYNNTIWGDPSFVLGSIDVRNNGTSGEIRNNVMNAAITYRGRDAAAGELILANNLENQAGSASALFVKVADGSGAIPAKGDFHLKAGSAAIDAGENAAEYVPFDIDGLLRPAGGAYDIGAYEYGGTKP